MLCLLNSVFCCFSLTCFSCFISFNVDTSSLIPDISHSIFFFHFGCVGLVFSACCYYCYDDDDDDDDDNDDRDDGDD